MEIKRFGRKWIERIVVFLASLSFGQFSIIVMDTILWTVQQTAKYVVQENSSAKSKRAREDYMEHPPMPWLVFFVVFIDLHIFCVLLSMILVKFNRKPIHLVDIARALRRWRRALHSLRLRGLIRTRKQQLRNKQNKGPKPHESESDTSEIHPHKKRRHCDELMDHNLLEELLNRTYPNTDLDSTYELERSEDDFITAGSNHGLEWDTIQSQSQHSAEDANTGVTCESTILEFSAEKSNPSVESSESSNSKTIANEKEVLNLYTDPISSGMNKESEDDTNIHSKHSTEDDTLPIKAMSESNDFVPNTDVTYESAILDSSAEKSNPSFEPIGGTNTVQSTSEPNNSKHIAEDANTDVTCESTILDFSAEKSNPSVESSESSNSKNIANEKEVLNLYTDPISSGMNKESEDDTNIHSKHSTEDDTLPIKAMSESNDFVPNTDVTCESAILDSSAEKSNPSFEPIGGTDTVQSMSEPNNSKHIANGKASLNQYTDPTDALIAKLVALNTAGKWETQTYLSTAASNENNG